MGPNQTGPNRIKWVIFRVGGGRSFFGKSFLLFVFRSFFNKFWWIFCFCFFINVRYLIWLLPSVRLADIEWWWCWYGCWCQILLFKYNSGGLGWVHIHTHTRTKKSSNLFFSNKYYLQPGWTLWLANLNQFSSA